jgi:hypothetical protein
VAQEKKEHKNIEKKKNLTSFFIYTVLGFDGVELFGRPNHGCLL